MRLLREVRYDPRLRVATTFPIAETAQLREVPTRLEKDKLKDFATEQAIGEKLNELTERYYRSKEPAARNHAPPPPRVVAA